MTSTEAKNMVIRWMIWVCIGFTGGTVALAAVDYFMPRTPGLVCACPCDNTMGGER